MIHPLYVVCILFAPVCAVRVGCVQNTSFTGISTGIWLNNSISCDVCTCYMIKTNSSASNCYHNGASATNCLIFANYSSATGAVQLVATSNSSSACFLHFPPTSTNPTTVLTTRSPTTTMQEATTAAPICAGYMQSTVLLELYNSRNQTYTRYSFVYRANSTRVTLMFCFLNQQHFWALDEVSMKDATTNVELIRNGGFEAANWNDWRQYNTIYYGSGIVPNRNSWLPFVGNNFYFDLQYTSADGIFQNITTVVGKNYSISFYLANPRGGNVSVAVVSVGP